LLKKSKNLQTTTSLTKGLEHANTIFILVPTPNGGNNRHYDHSILSNLLVKINQQKPKYKNIIIGCTVMPKYCDEVAIHLLEDCEGCSLSYNPEFIAQGDIVRGFEKPDIILVGTNDKERVEPLMLEIYGKMARNVPKYCIMNLLEAEITKIGINGYITTKLSYANMISDYCDTIGANKYTVLDAIGSDTRIGSKYFNPGFSFGGPCFPRDTKALKQCLDKVHIQNTLLEATTQYNEWHTEFQTDQWLRELVQTNQQSVVIEGVCYKEGSKIPIIEESAKLKIATKLARCIPVTIRDVPEIIEEVKKEHGNLFTYEYL
jgi:nucleotide sugar dehydrogenase